MSTGRRNIDYHIQRIFRLELQDNTYCEFKNYAPLAQKYEKLLGLRAVNYLVDDLRNLHIQCSPWAVRSEPEKLETSDDDADEADEEDEIVDVETVDADDEDDEDNVDDGGYDLNIESDEYFLGGYDDLEPVWTDRMAPPDGRFVLYLFRVFARNYTQSFTAKLDKRVYSTIESVVVRHIGDAIERYELFGSLADITQQFVDIFQSYRLQQVPGLLENFLNAMTKEVFRFVWNAQPSTAEPKDGCLIAYRDIMHGFLGQLGTMMRGHTLLSLHPWVMKTLVALVEAEGNGQWFAAVVLKVSKPAIGDDLYAETFLGRMLRLSVLPKRADDSVPLPNDVRLLPAYRQHMGQCYRVFDALLRHCPSQTLSWIGSCLQRNAHAKIGSPTASLLLSLASVLLRIFPTAQFAQTASLASLDPTYCSLHDPAESKSRSVHLRNLHGLSMQQPAARFQYPDDFRFDQPTELFFMCHRAIDLSFRKWWHRFYCDYCERAKPGRPIVLSGLHRLLVIVMNDDDQLLQQFSAMTNRYLDYLVLLCRDSGDRELYDARYDCLPHFVSNNQNYYAMSRNCFAVHKHVQLGEQEEHLIDSIGQLTIAEALCDQPNERSAARAQLAINEARVEEEPHVDEVVLEEVVAQLVADEAAVEMEPPVEEFVLEEVVAQLVADEAAVEMEQPVDEFVLEEVVVVANDDSELVKRPESAGSEYEFIEHFELGKAEGDN